ncbi:MAG: FAD-dependent oxidoreductase [Acetobacteraceae bacterium]
MAAGLGHRVTVWERAAVPGGQVPLALASPDKADVAGVWSYRAAELATLGVGIDTGVTVSAAAIRQLRPDMVVVATGARPRELPTPLDVAVPVVQAWAALLDPTLVAPGAVVTIIGGGMVGIETADLLGVRGCRVTVVELSDVVAREMARNNKFDVLARVEASGAEIITNAAILRVEGNTFVLRVPAGEIRRPVGDVVVLAIGPEPERGAMPEVEATGLPFVLAGDCNRPGDFMTAIRDGSMAAIAAGLRLPVRSHSETAR